MGKFHRILEPGLNLLIPIIDTVKYVQILKEIAIEIPQQSAITFGISSHSDLNCIIYIIIYLFFSNNN